MGGRAKVALQKRQAARAVAQQCTDCIGIHKLSTQDILSPRQCRAARGLLGWSQDQLADAANVARATIANFETGKTQPVGNNLSAIRAAFEAAGVAFIPENGGGDGVRMAKPDRNRSAST